MRLSLVETNWSSLEQAGTLANSSLVPEWQPPIAKVARYDPMKEYEIKNRMENLQCAMEGVPGFPKNVQ